ncbi:uncharacterized protein [Physcomitrium patens]|uniref:C2 domain-containing protein n=1 Tax=Physcomitrium patens TaxID=3218 RepID=A0A2K1KE67_PHYPA|nr:uncharacterized protein LOC112283472 isoform X1 [Physcomitrium patens]XP_024377928.1 uncharacterized protein LOC112283472 isoform X1 [Physcomitrium patens]XP_024377929.1 uncharacterized protein LOC112283472 isoform X1 [Physcomitrium patens]PNR52074.1 hypothetical protein PHYPA_008448 [Physcomitrium patens]|eukprot:XP_024377927.1 uncharacterized protein LOC112283472 isoform X1 [Physcomitrella patens]
MTVCNLLLKVKRAEGVDACVPFKTHTRVYVTVTHKGTVYTTASIEDMGQNPNWDEGLREGAIWFPVIFDIKDTVILELFNSKDKSIGKAILNYAEIRDMRAGQQKDISLQVMVPRFTSSRQRQFGDLFVAVQMTAQQARGEHGDLQLKLRGGYVKGMTSILSRVSEVSVKLSYLHTTYKSGILGGQGDKFLWVDGSFENTFTFLIDTQNENQIIKVQVYNYQLLVGECVETVGKFKRERTVALPLNARGRSVGNIEVATEFTLNHFTRTTPTYPNGSEQIPTSFPDSPYSTPEMNMHNMMDSFVNSFVPQIPALDRTRSGFYSRS